MLRTRLYAEPHGRFVHDIILESCRRYPQRTALVDTSCDRRITYSEYGDLLESLARGFVAAGLKPQEKIAIYLPNSWEFAAAYHAATMAGAIPTLLNPTYREREVRFQLENADATFLITDGELIRDINLTGLPQLKRIYTTRHAAAGTSSFADLFRPTVCQLPAATQAPEQALAALPYSSGTTGLPKGVMLSHYNLAANIYQIMGPHAAPFEADDNILCFLPLYHIYGLNVVLNPALTIGAAIVLMPRFNVSQVTTLIGTENINVIPAVPPALNALAQAAELGQFPPKHAVRRVKSGAAPLAPDLARRFTTLTGIPIGQGYGMTEASPVTHLGYIEPELYRPESIGQPVAQTECRILDENDNDAHGQPGELVMRGPQFMLGYWKEPQATAAVLRDGWYWSGDVVRRDENDFYYIVDRRKEMIKYKGFAVAPAEVEAVLLEHPAVRDCGVVPCPDAGAGEIPVAFVVLREGVAQTAKLDHELCEFVAQRLTHYKQPRKISIVDIIPRSASGKILRRELRKVAAQP